MNTLPPHNADAERALIAALFYEPDTLDVVSTTVGVEDFYLANAALAFEAVADLREAGQPVDAVTVVEQVKRRQPDVDPVWYVTMQDHVPETCIVHAEDYARTIRENATRRRLAHRALEAHRRALDPTRPTEDAAAMLGSELGSSRFTVSDYGMSELESAKLDVEWRVRHLLTRSEPAILGGPRKSLKTSVSIDLAMSLATGTRFLGRFNVTEPCRVGLISAESGAPTIRETLRRVAKSKGVKLDTVDRLFVSFDLPRLAEDSHVHAVRSWIRRRGLEVAIFDPIYLMLADEAADAKNLFSMGARLRRISEAVQGLGCQPIINHHATKPAARQFEPLELDDLAFSGFAEFARQWILVSRREKYRGDQPGRHRLWFGYGGSAGHAGLFGVDVDEGTVVDGRTWSVDVRDADDARRDSKSDTQRQREAQDQRKHDENRGELCRALREHPNGETRKQLRESAGLSGRVAGPIEAELLREELVVVVQIRKPNGHTYDGLKATEKLLGTCYRDDRDALGQNGTLPLNGGAGRDY